MRIRIKLGAKGQIIIPKIVRDSVGLVENGPAILEVKEKTIEIRPLPAKDLIERARERARKHGADIKKSGWIYGDKLYEEVFK
ncbi:MAG: AbrB/MazE/SpoVT family DNA-binding domain-containing protein [Thaumarchaeota archaeon]|nr:AbrB/MazE/SpoVT family DNA-binding domain-containing protein [Nitrososphaerota archaeon]